MQTIMLDGSMYDSARELHLALKKMLSGADEVASAIARISRVIEDNGGVVKELT